MHQPIEVEEDNDEGLEEEDIANQPGSLEDDEEDDDEDMMNVAKMGMGIGGGNSED